MSSGERQIFLEVCVHPMSCLVRSAAVLIISILLTSESVCREASYKNFRIFDAVLLNVNTSVFPLLLIVTMLLPKCFSSFFLLIYSTVYVGTLTTEISHFLH